LAGYVVIFVQGVVGIYLLTHTYPEQLPDGINLGTRWDLVSKNAKTRGRGQSIYGLLIARNLSL
jgi:hypothetical protein